MAWVLGAGVVAAIARHSPGLAQGGQERRDALFSIAVVALAIFAGMRLVGQVVAVARGRVAAVPGTTVRAGAIVWRAVILLVLVGCAAEHSRVLMLASGAGPPPGTWPSPTWPTAGLRQALLGQGGIWLLVGLVLGLRPGPRRPAIPPAEQPGLPWVSVSVAGAAGLLYYTLTQGPIPYLVLNAVEAVSNALNHVPYRGPGLWTRLDRAALPAALAVGTGLVAAMITLRDLQWAASDPRGAEALSGRAAWPRRLAAVGAIGSASYIAVATIPMLHPSFAEGIALVLGPWETTLVVVTFAGLAAGIAARGVATGWDPRPPRLPSALTRRARTLRLLVRIVTRPLAPALLILVGVAVATDKSAFLTGISAGQQTGLERVVLGIRGAIDARIPRADDVWPLLMPEVLVRELALVWLALQVVILLVTADAPRAAPFDVVLSRPEAARSFLEIWATLTLLFLAALPTFFVAGLVVFHALLGVAFA
jgi:hypothetical protein